MISDRSCDIEYGSNDAENSAFFSQKQMYIQIKKWLISNCTVI